MANKPKFYTQVGLRRKPIKGGKSPFCADGSRWMETSLETGERYWHTVTWVPSKFATVGHFLEIKNPETGVMENHWEVVWCGSRVDTAKVEDAERDHKRQRSASDV